MDYLVRIGNVEIECLSAGAAVRLVAELRGRYQNTVNDCESRKQQVIDRIRQHGPDNKSNLLRACNIPVGSMHDVFKDERFTVVGKLVQLADELTDDEPKEPDEPEESEESDDIEEPDDETDVETEDDTDDEEDIPIPKQMPTNKSRVEAALNAQPGQTIAEIAENSGLKKNQVSATLYAYQRTEFRRDNDGKWFIRNGEAIAEVIKPPDTRPLAMLLLEILRREQPLGANELARMTKQPFKLVFTALADDEKFERMADGMYWVR
jgi:predicted transcriptional regulator